MKDQYKHMKSIRSPMPRPGHVMRKRKRDEMDKLAKKEAKDELRKY